MKYLITTLVLALTLVACEPSPTKSTADQRQAQQTAQLTAEADRQTGMPAMVNFQEKKLLKSLYELRDQADLITYAYITTLDGRLVFLGQCVGYGLPYSTQYSNPERVVANRTFGNGGSIYGTLPQPEPNGLFIPEGLSATWLQMLNPETGDVLPVYVEQEIIVSPFKLHDT